MSLDVLDPGLCSLLVDRGRPSGRRYGVPVGGAADATALALGNALVGNSVNCAALEVALAGPRLRADADTGAVIFGAPFDLFLNGTAIRPGVTFTWPSGQELSIGGALRGTRAYLCVVGGFQAPEVLGSCSSLAPIRRDDRLACSASRIHSRYLPEGVYEARDDSPSILRYVPGSQVDRFDETQFQAEHFVVAKASNRMGLRLEEQGQGGTILSGADREIVSEPVCPGTVQVTRDGQCIVLGVDGQTIGGYPKLAHVIGADMPVVGQLRPGAVVRFQKVTLSEAEEIARAQREFLQEWVMRLRVAEKFHFGGQKNMACK